MNRIQTRPRFFIYGVLVTLALYSSVLASYHMYYDLRHDYTVGTCFYTNNDQGVLAIREIRNREYWVIEKSTKGMLRKRMDFKKFEELVLELQYFTCTKNI